MVGMTGDIYINRPPAVAFDFVAETSATSPSSTLRMTAVTLVSGVGGTPGPLQPQ